jgi:hypothetical protein
MTRIIGQSSALLRLTQTATVVLTFEKFVSFALSIVLLSPPRPGEAASGRDSPGIWLGSCAVLLGTLAYSRRRSQSWRQSRQAALPNGSRRSDQ